MKKFLLVLSMLLMIATISFSQVRISEIASCEIGPNNQLVNVQKLEFNHGLIGFGDHKISIVVDNTAWNFEVLEDNVEGFKMWGKLRNMEDSSLLDFRLTVDEQGFIYLFIIRGTNVIAIAADGNQ